MSRPRSESGGPAAAASNRRRRALTYDDLPKEIKGVIKDYAAFTNDELQAAVEEYFEDKAATERRHGKIGTWDVGRVTDMSELFKDRTDFNEARAGVRRSVIFSTRVEECRFRTANLPSSMRVRSPTSKYGFRRTSARGTRRR